MKSYNFAEHIAYYFLFVSI